MIKFAILLLFATFNSNAQEVCKTKLQKSLLLSVYQITLCRQGEVSYDKIFDSMFSIKLEYKISSSGGWIASRSLHEIQKHYKLTKDEQLFYKNYFDGFFPSVKSGDEILMQFTPQKGAMFYYNGKFFGEIKDINFAIRTANIWLHPNSTFKDTRDFLFLNE